MASINEYSSHRTRRRKSAFTLVEILVALAIMMLLLAILLVPINMALNVFHIGKARNEVKQANQVVLNQLAAELRQAVYVYPNEKMPGITDKAPYTGNNQQPYFQLNTSTNCQVSNTARLDFLLPSQGASGAVGTPLKASNYVVTYYARRLDTGKAYDAYSNPVVLFRAQYPYRNDDGTGSANADASITRYPAGSCGATAATASKEWLTQTESGETDLEPLCAYSPLSQTANHTLITPRDMGLVAPNAADTPTPSYQPDSSFTCDDTNGDGKIDRVTMNINMAKYDSIGADSKNQRVRLSQTVDLPNVK